MTGPERPGEPGEFRGRPTVRLAAPDPWVAAGRGRPRFGVYGGLTNDWARDVERVQLAEALGFDAFWVADHPLSHGRDPWSYLAALAPATWRIRLGTLVTSANYRPSALLARIVADVDRISGGRVVLGIGIGDNPRDSARPLAPYPPVPARQAAPAAALRVLRPLLAGEEAELPGDDRVVLTPGPVQARVPILLAGGGERVTLRGGRRVRRRVELRPREPHGQRLDAGRRAAQVRRAAGALRGGRAALRVRAAHALRRPPPRGGRRDARGVGDAAPSATATSACRPIPPAPSCALPRADRTPACSTSSWGGCKDPAARCASSANGCCRPSGCR